MLTNSINEVEGIRKAIKEIDLPFEILWEDNGELGHLIRRIYIDKKEKETALWKREY